MENYKPTQEEINEVLEWLKKEENIKLLDKSDFQKLYLKYLAEVFVDVKVLSYVLNEADIKVTF